MTKETITYTDLNGVQRTEDFYFDLSKPEIVKMQASAKGCLLYTSLKKISGGIFWEWAYPIGCSI